MQETSHILKAEYSFMLTCCTLHVALRAHSLIVSINVFAAFEVYLDIWY